MRTLHLRRMEIFTAIQRHGIVHAQLQPAGQCRRKASAPPRPPHLLPELRLDLSERLGCHAIQNLAHLGIGRNLVHPKDRLQITPLALLLHRPLELQQTGMLEKHQGKATHHRVGQGVVPLLRRSAIRYRVVLYFSIYGSVFSCLSLWVGGLNNDYHPSVLSGLSQHPGHKSGDTTEWYATLS